MPQHKHFHVTPHSCELPFKMVTQYCMLSQYNNIYPTSSFVKYLVSLFLKIIDNTAMNIFMHLGFFFFFFFYPCSIVSLDDFQEPKYKVECYFYGSWQVWQNALQRLSQLKPPSAENHLTTTSTRGVIKLKGKITTLTVICIYLITGQTAQLSHVLLCSSHFLCVICYFICLPNFPLDS